jgi:hypothetical protein
MEQFLREWRKNALDKHQWESAIFIADKLLAVTSRSIPIDQYRSVSIRYLDLLTCEYRQ